MSLPKLSWLTTIEALAIVSWLAMAGFFVADQAPEHAMAAIDPAALVQGPSQERYNGIFFNEQQVGYAVSRVTPTAEGGTLYEDRSNFRFATFGRIQDISTASAAVVDGQGRLARFDFFMSSDDVNLSARGEVRGKQIVMEVEQGGETTTMSFDVDDPPQVGASLESVVARQELSVGMKLSVPYFDPVTMAQGQMQLDVTGVEVLENGEEAYWLTSTFSGVQTRSLVTPAGDTLRQETALGLSVVRMTREAALAGPQLSEPPDLIAMSSVRLAGFLQRPRQAHHLTLRIGGVDPERVRNEPPLQRLVGDLVTVDVPLREELPQLPVADRSEPRWLEATATLPVDNPEIRERAAQVVGDAPDRREATRRLVDHVYEYVDKVPTIGVPNGLEVLHTARGDCNEHTALFVSLARAAGIPSRIAAGVVYSDRIDERGAFYYHAWPEVRLGGPTEWVPVDPTFGQFPADATHVKLVEGDLERQVEIMGVMGKLAFELIEVKGGEGKK